MTSVALVHDYLTQRGGAERVVLSLLRAFPDAPLYTSLFDPEATFPEFATQDVRPLPLNHVGLLRHHHRLALPLLAPEFSSLRIDSDVTVCSSSGWAHGVRTRGRKLVYCHTPARWLYQPDRYLRGSKLPLRAAAKSMRPALIRWDRRAALSADRYLANSTSVRDRIRDIYGIDAAVLHPPPSLTPDGAVEQVADLEPGFLLSVARLLPYKNLDAAIGAVTGLPGERLVVVGTGPDEERLRRLAPPNVRFVGSVDDAQMRWLFRSCAALVAPSHEDYGLTPLEAASFGKPAVVLRFGGFLDTVLDRETGVFVDEPTAGAVREGIERLRKHEWDSSVLRAHAAKFSEDRFIAALQREVEELSATDRPAPFHAQRRARTR